jgi:hypothetical protein
MSGIVCLSQAPNSPKKLISRHNMQPNKREYEGRIYVENTCIRINACRIQNRIRIRNQLKSRIRIRQKSFRIHNTASRTQRFLNCHLYYIYSLLLEVASAKIISINATWTEEMPRNAIIVKKTPQWSYSDVSAVQSQTLLWTVEQTCDPHLCKLECRENQNGSDTQVK